jgi:hypothetical protein
MQTKLRCSRSGCNWMNTKLVNAIALLQCIDFTQNSDGVVAVHWMNTKLNWELLHWLITKVQMELLQWTEWLQKLGWSCCGELNAQKTLDGVVAAHIWMNLTAQLELLWYIEWSQKLGWSCSALNEHPRDKLAVVTFWNHVQSFEVNSSEPFDSLDTNRRLAMNRSNTLFIHTGTAAVDLCKFRFSNQQFLCQCGSWRLQLVMGKI